MKRTLTRRRAVSILAATAAAGLGRLNGLVPELSLLTPQTLKAPGAGAKWRVRELSGDEGRERVNAAIAHRNGAAALAAIARRGLVMRPADASAIALSWDDGQPVGDLVRIPVFDPRTGRQGSFVHVNAGEKVVSGFSLESAGDGARDIYRVSDGIASRSSTMRPAADGGKVISWADGHRTVLPPIPGGGVRASAPGAKAGLAAPGATTCYNACDFWCQVTYVIVCTVESFFYCEGGCLGFPPCSFICEAVMILVCAYSAVQYCQSSCNIVCF